MENQENTMTIKDVMASVRNILMGIKVPAYKMDFEMYDQISVPISKSINGLNACLEAIERDEATKAAEAQQNGEASGDEIEVVPVGDDEGPDLQVVEAGYVEDKPADA